ncbi:MAG: cupin domain-containing protein [Planctomycetota bacterium]|jgi:quercetin dioxygenase-like cupin family protein
MADLFFDTATSARYSDEKMAKTNLFESPRMFCDVYALKPGQSQKPHDHAENDKVYHVLTGRPTIRIGDEAREVGPGVTAVAPAGVIHGVVNESDGDATLLVMMAPHPRYEG